MSNNYEGTILFWLLPSTSEQADLSADISALQKIVNDTRIFFDPDQCIDELASITDLTIFLLLGPTRSDLLPILHTFAYLRRIYLSEPHEYAQNTSQVRGVFPTIPQLLPYLTKDVLMAQQVDSHLIVTCRGDPIQSHRSIVDLQSSKADFQWKQAMIDIILDTPIPLKENVHKDLIDEWRLVYQSNAVQTRFIDDFEATYDPSNTIHWYTRDTFLFKMVNMALRTENIIVIWRLRFFIQDLYRQLQRLHAEERKSRSSTQRQILTLYRGQHMSTSELNQLKECEGGLIAMISFVSTTKQLGVAEAFAGNGEGQPEMESVIFEFILDESVHDYERSPFADISAFSSKRDEEEVLLSPGTALQVESVQMKGQVTWVRIRMCQREENELQRQLLIARSDPRIADSYLAETEMVSLDRLYVVLQLTGRFRQAEEIMKLMQPLVNSFTGAVTDPILTFYFEFLSSRLEFQQLDPADADYDHRLQAFFSKQQKAVRAALDSRPFEDRFSVPFLSLISLIDELLHMPKSDQDNIDISTLCMEFSERVKACCPMDIQPMCNLTQKRMIETQVGTEKLTAQSYEVKMQCILEAYNDKQFSNKDPQRIEWCWYLANDAYKKNDYDQAIQLLREGLAIPSNKVDHARLYRRLYGIYDKQENWLAVIECCHNILSMPQLPPNSSFIVDAYLKCGKACTELEDYSEALLNYTKALELQEQHHPPRHPCTAEIHVELGNLFSTIGDTATAMKHFEIAIALDFPKSTNEAHLRTAMICIPMRKYDEARFHLYKCLDIGQHDSSSSAWSIARNYLLLAKIEHITGDHQLRDAYFQQGSSLTNSNEEDRNSFSEIAREILNIPFPSSS